MQPRARGPDSTPFPEQGWVADQVLSRNRALHSSFIFPGCLSACVQAAPQRGRLQRSQPGQETHVCKGPWLLALAVAEPRRRGLKSSSDQRAQLDTSDKTLRASSTQGLLAQGHTRQRTNSGHILTPHPPLGTSANTRWACWPRYHVTKRGKQSSFKNPIPIGIQFQKASYGRRRSSSLEP